jgi:hypothetical protein
LAIGSNTREENSMQERTDVVVTNIQMPFFSMVIFMVKWTLASIPALIILILLAAVLAAALGGIARGLF